MSDLMDRFGGYGAALLVLGYVASARRNDLLGCEKLAVGRRAVAHPAVVRAHQHADFGGGLRTMVKAPLSLPYERRTVMQRQTTEGRTQALSAVIDGAGEIRERLEAVEEFTALTKDLIRIGQQDIHAAFGDWATAMGMLLPVAGENSKVRARLNATLATFESEALTTARFMRNHRLRTERQLRALGRALGADKAD